MRTLLRRLASVRTAAVVLQRTKEWPATSCFSPPGNMAMTPADSMASPAVSRKGMLGYASAFDQLAELAGDIAVAEREAGDAPAHASGRFSSASGPRGARPGARDARIGPPGASQGSETPRMAFSEASHAVPRRSAA